jgi:hypothetical protein
MTPYYMCQKSAIPASSAAKQMKVNGNPTRRKSFELVISRPDDQQVHRMRDRRQESRACGHSHMHHRDSQRDSHSQRGNVEKICSRVIC